MLGYCSIHIWYVTVNKRGGASVGHTLKEKLERDHYSVGEGQAHSQDFVSGGLGAVAQKSPLCVTNEP